MRTDVRRRPSLRPAPALWGRILRLRPRPCGLALATGLALTASVATAQDLFWDANGTDPGTGGSGTWTDSNTWRSGADDGPLGDWVDGRNAVFGGTAGSVSIGATAVSPTASFFNVTGYTLQTDASATTRSHNGAIILADSVVLNLLFPNTTASRNLNIGGNISGGDGSGLVIQGNQSVNNAARINLSVNGAEVSVPTSIGSTGTGIAGFVATASNTVVSGDITNNTDARTMLGATSGNNLTFSGQHSGSGSLQFSAGPTGGAGPVLITGTLVHSGDTIFNHAFTGVVQMGSDNRLSDSSVLEFTNGTLDLNGTSQTVAGLSGDGGRGIVNTSVDEGIIIVDITSGTQTYGGQIGGIPANTTNLAGVNSGIALIKKGAGIQILAGETSFTGETTIEAGRLSLDDLAALGGSSKVTVEDGGQLRLQVAGTYTTGGAIHLAGTGEATLGALRVQPSGNLGFNGGIVLDDDATIHVNHAAGVFTHGGAFSAVAGNALTKTGAGALVFSGANPGWAGDVALTNGSITVESTSNFSTGRLLMTTINNDVTLTLDNASQTIGGLDSAIAGTGDLFLNLADGHVLTVDQGTDGTFLGVISGAGASLIKTGPATLVLAGPNTYTGGTTVSQGVLEVSNTTGSGTGSGPVLVESIATLTGTGHIAGPTTILGTHAPGASPGVQSFASDLTYSGASIVWELVDNTSAGRGANFDGIDVGGDLEFLVSNTFNLVFDLPGSTVSWLDPFWESSQSWLVFDVGGDILSAENLLLQHSDWLDGSGVAFSDARSGFGFQIRVADEGVFLDYAAVPEPTQTMLLAVGALALLLRRRREP